MAETAAPSRHVAEPPARRRWDPLSPASRFWLAFALALVLLCLGGFSMPLVFGVPDNDPRVTEFADVLGEADASTVFVVYLLLTFLYFRRESPEAIRARAAARYGRRLFSFAYNTAILALVLTVLFQ